MHSRMGYALAALTAIAWLAVSSPARAAFLFAPGQEWWSISTPHFIIHYPAPLAERARSAAPLLEAAHARLTPRMEWTPANRTHVVITDDFDPANGMATALPFNLMILFASPPDGDTDLMLNPDGWMETLVTHEYTHILHLDRAEGLPGGLQQLFGRMPLLFPNAYNTGWMVEGLATLEETANGRYGRGRGALFSGILRTQAAEQKLPPISKASHTYSTWPGGMGAYLYGVHFLQFLNNTFGEHTTGVLVREYSDNIIPFTVGPNMRKVLRESPTRAWDRWRNALDRQAKLAGDGTPGSQRITHSGFYTQGGRVSPDGRLLAWSERTSRDHARLMLAPADNPSAARELAWRNGGRALGWSADSRILYLSQPEFSGSFRLYDDLYAVRLPKGKTRRLTHGARLRDPAVLPDGTLIAVQNEPSADATRLVRVDPSRPRARPEVIFEPEPGVVVSHPRPAPGGGAVAVSATRPEGGRNIALIGMDGSETWITRGRARDADPAFSPDGRYLLFSSDRTGIFNLFAWDSADGSLWRITDEIGGAFAPEVDPSGGTIFYTGLNGDGFDQYRMPFDPTAWEKVTESDVAPETPPLPPFPKTTATIHPVDRIIPQEGVSPSAPRRYSPFPAVLPHFWWPSIYGDNNHAYYGAFTLGADPLLRHAYAADLTVDFNNQKFVGSLLYQYDRFWPTISFLASRLESGTTYDALVPGQVHSRTFEDNLALAIAFPWRRVNQQATLQLGAETERQFNEVVCSAPCAATPPPAFENRYLLGLIAWSNAQRYGLGISRTDGRTLIAAHKESRTGFGGDFNGAVSRATWDEYLPLGHGGHVLHARGITGEADTAVPFRAGGVPGFVDDPYDRAIPVRGQRKRALTGGTGMVAGTLEYRFPFALPEKGGGTMPLFLEKLHGRLFYDTARLYDSVNGWKGVNGSGIEIGFDTVFAYYIPITFLAGYANGNGVTGEDQVYLRVSLGE
ncbi:MAG: hypothetical protein OEY97_05490 [Nitrospirota bacterium]|nr:hypothetical protein [Nitrospirota bacterium]